MRARYYYILLLLISPRILSFISVIPLCNTHTPSVLLITLIHTQLC